MDTSGENVIWSVRVPKFVKKFFQEKGISGRKIILDAYYRFYENQLENLLKERNLLMKRLLEIDENVLQIRTKCNTFVIQNDDFCNTKSQNVIQNVPFCNTFVIQNEAICNTIFDEFKKQGRDIFNVTEKDKYWLKRRLEYYNLHMVDVNSFIAYFRRKEEMKKAGGDDGVSKT